MHIGGCVYLNCLLCIKNPELNNFFYYSFKILEIHNIVASALNIEMFFSSLEVLSVD